MQRLQDPMVRKQIKKRLAPAKWLDFQLVLISSVSNPELKKWEGKRFSDVIAASKKDPLKCECLISWLQIQDGRTVLHLV